MLNMQSIPSMPKSGSYPLHVPMHKGRARRFIEKHNMGHKLIVNKSPNPRTK